MSQTDRFIHEEAPRVQDYLGALRHRKWAVIGVTALLTAIALGGSTLLTPVYTSTTRILVARPDLGGPAEAINLETEAELISSPRVAGIVADALRHGGDLDDLLEGLSVRVPGTAGGQLLEVSYEYSDPRNAQRFAQGFADGYLAFRQRRAREGLLTVSSSLRESMAALEDELQDVSLQLEGDVTPSERAALETRMITIGGRMADLQQQLGLQSPPQDLYVGEVIAPAGLPAKPSQPNYVLNGGLGFAVGLLLGIGLALLRERLDKRVRRREDVERIATTLLGTIPKARRSRRNRTIIHVIQEPTSPTAEAYKALRARLLFLASQRPVRTVLVTSPGRGEGKSGVVANLGAVLAQAHKRVVLVSADLRQPRLHRFFDLEGSPGLTDVLGGQASWHNAGTGTALDDLRIIPTGAIPESPAELLVGEPLSRLLQELERVTDFVLLDSAPILDLADTLPIASVVDAVLLVADAEATTRAELARACSELRQVGATVVGVVLNRFDPARSVSSDHLAEVGFHTGFGSTHPVPPDLPESLIEPARTTGQSLGTR